MSRKLALLLLIVLAFSISSCGSTDLPAQEDSGPANLPAQEDQENNEPADLPAQDEEVHLTFSFWGSVADEEAYTARLALVTEKFPNVTVEPLYIPSDYDQTILTRFAGGDSPDLIFFSEQIHAFSSKGQLLGLNDYIESSGIDLEGLYGTIMPRFTRDGVIYALPDRGASMVLYYNKDMFDAAGIGYPTKEWKWDDFLSAAQALTLEAEDGSISQYGFASATWWPHWMCYVFQNGGNIIDEAGTPTFNTPEVIEGVQFWHDLIYKHHVTPTPDEWANMGFDATGAPDPLFAQGKVAMVMTGFWNIAALRDVPDLNWDIAPLFGQVQNATVPFVGGIAISSQTEHPDVAWQVLQFLESAEGQQLIVDLGQDAPTNIDLLTSDEFLGEDYAGRVINMEAFADSADMIVSVPLIPEWNEMWQIVGNYIGEVYLDTMSVEDAANATQAELETLLGSN